MGGLRLSLAAASLACALTASCSGGDGKSQASTPAAPAGPASSVAEASRPVQPSDVRPAPAPATESANGAIAAPPKVGAASAPANPIPAAFTTADTDAGEAEFAKCRNCHNLAAADGNAVGPNLHGLFGRKAGALPNFKYTDAMKARTEPWSFETLDIYLADPQKVVPGTSMFFTGVKNEKSRRDLIAYLSRETSK